MGFHTFRPVLSNDYVSNLCVGIPPGIPEIGKNLEIAGLSGLLQNSHFAAAPHNFMQV
jgi:hypothetical protein